MSCPPLPDQNKWLEQGDAAAETALWSRVHLSRMKSITTRRQGWERALGYPSARAAPNQVPLKAVVGNYPLQEHHEESREC